MSSSSSSTTRTSTHCGGPGWTCRLAGGGHPPSCHGASAWRRSIAPGPTSPPRASGAGVAADARDGARPAGGAANGDRFVHELFAEQAVRRPDAVAVIAGRTRVSYRELDASANRLAHYLGEIGAGPEAVIGVYLERGVDVIRSILAIMKAGAGYLPLDPSLPPERLSRICSQVRPAAVITARRGHVPRDRGRGCCRWASSPPSLAAGRRRRPPSPCTRTTSATSSTPRGPPATRSRSPSATAAWPASSASWRASTRSPTTTGWRRWPSMAFDTSIEQMFVALTSGATLLLPPPGTMAPSELLRRIERRQRRCST